MLDWPKIRPHKTFSFFPPQLFCFMHLLSHFLCSCWKRKAFSSAELSSSSEKGSVWGKTGISACQVPFFLEPEGEERAVTAGSYVLGGRWKNRGITQNATLTSEGGEKSFKIIFPLSVTDYKHHHWGSRTIVRICYLDKSLSFKIYNLLFKLLFFFCCSKNLLLTGWNENSSIPRIPPPLSGSLPDS